MPNFSSAWPARFEEESFEVIGKAIALIQVPNQRLFGPKAAARYLGIDTDTLRKITEEGQLAAHDFRGRRTYRLEELDRLCESLPGWKNGAGETPVSANLPRSINAK